MTEKEWLKAREPLSLWYARYARNGRKRRLAVCACARRVLALLGDDLRATALLEAVERYADSSAMDRHAKWRAVIAARTGVRVLLREFWETANLPMHRLDALNAVYECSYRNPSGLATVFNFAKCARRGRQITPGVSEPVAQSMILRDVFGNPFRPVEFDHEWRTTTVVAIARGMYESRDFGAIPILADAMEDAGCNSDDMLMHCRAAKGIHVRGCWVVDWVLDKAH